MKQILRRVIGLIGLAILFNSLLFSATGKKEKYSKKKYVKAADKAYKEGSIFSSADLYQKILEHEPNNSSVLINLANSYYLARDYESAEKYFAEAYKADSIGNSTALYYEALMLKMQAKYQQAIPFFTRFMKGTKKSTDASGIRKWAKTEIDGCNFALQEMKPNPNIVLTHLGREVNSNYAEASPALNDSVLFFASIRSDTVIVKKQVMNQEEKEVAHMKLFSSKMNNGNYLSSEKIEDLSKPDKHITNPSFSADGKTFFYTECEDKKGKIYCRIFKAEYHNGKLEHPEALNDEINLPNTTNSQPYFVKTAAGLDVLYFVSDRIGGKGGTDIWYAVANKKGEFSAPKNCGNKVNTDRDEVSPFYDRSSNTLYFSSNGWISMGGFDIFKSQGEPGKNMSIENMGTPFNSSCDDIYFRFPQTEKKGYLVSNRPGIFSVRGKTCCDDIFAYEFLRQIHIAVKGKVYEEGTSKVISSAAVSLSLKGDNQADNEVVIATDTTHGDDYYFFNLKPDKQYKLSGAKDGYFAASKSFNTNGINTSDTLIEDLYLKVLEKNKEYRLGNIYYDFNKWDLREEAKRTLDTLYNLLIENPTIIIELGSHTDARGSDIYNQELSQKRAESCVTYLIGRGIDKSRITAKGYGKTKLLQDCSKIENCPTDQNGDCECHQLNRRTVFKITGQLDGKLLYENNE